MNMIIGSLVAAWLALGLVFVAADMRWVAHIKKHHREVWVRLGEPRLLPFQDISVIKRLNMFVNNGEYQRLRYPRLVGLTLRRRMLGRIYTVVGILVMSIVGLIIWTQYKNRYG